MSSSQIIECAPCYELKYDETLDKLRDQTFSELKIAYGKNNKIKCNCWTDRGREYKVDSAFVASHMKSQKHMNWREEQQKEHKRKYGHCISSEKIIETLRKELREYKKLHVNSVEINNNKGEKLELMSKKLDEVSDENDIFKDELEEYQGESKVIKKENDDLKDELENTRIENEVLKSDLEEYKKDIISLTKENDQFQFRLNSRKLTVVDVKKPATKSALRQPFR